ncbi:armadillo repeat-containing protein 3-like isoform X2 [Clytia hemisphaerica]|uniref:armadillo repeat-containing protein 3-like isoform X2 n=1 Tax=Clytia hemisphaerica TaxID=252671 RepID=UPI0034D55A1F
MGKKKGGKESEVPLKEEFDPVELVTKKPQTVTLMLQSAEESVLQTVCDSLYKYAEKSQENKAQMVNLGVLEHLPRLISHEDKLVKRSAIMCIGSMSSENSCKKILRRIGCVKPLLQLLSPDEEIICHEFSTLALSNLAETFTSKIEIFEQNGLQLLVNHLSSTDCDVQKNTVHAVSLLVEEFQNRAAMKDLHGFEPLLKLLDSDYPVIQELALSTLITCSQDAENRGALRELEAMNKLVDIIGNETWSDLHILALQCLANLLEDTETLRAIQTTGVFDKLLAFITGSSSSPEIQQFTMIVIAAASRLEENRRIFNEQETEKTLITLLTSDNIQVSISAVKAIAALSENLSSRDKIGRLDGIPNIMKLLSHENEEAREIATLALSNLTNANQNNCNILMDKNSLDVIVKLLSDKKYEIQSNTAVLLSNLAMNESWRNEIKKHGVVKALMEPLKSESEQVQLDACQALAAFLCDVDARNKLLTLDEGILNVVNLLRSPNGSVQRNAAWVLAMCAVDENIAEEITKYGGLELLQQIQHSSTRKNPVVDMAWSRLLNNNLPAKYALTGELGFDNTLESLFFDVGKIRGDSQFLPLPLLFNEEVNNKRPVILVNPKKNATSGSNSKRANKDEEKHTASPSKPASVEKPEKQRTRTRNDRRMRVGRDNREEPIISGGTNTVSEKPLVETIPSLPALSKFVTSISATEDKELLNMVQTVQSTIGGLSDLSEQITSLALFVSDRMGGNVERSDFTNFSFELHISELKTELASNVIPIGRIKCGIYYHRALLFKVLADQIALRCSLMRGEYGRAWNEVQIMERSETGQPILPPKVFVVDLMHNPGELFPKGSPEAVKYQRI